MTKIAILLVTLGLLSACATWEGIKSDVSAGADAVSDAL